MAKSKGGLGRGLGALLPAYDEPEEILKEGQASIIQLELDMVKANPEQPRKHFDEDQMMDLVESIKEHGVVQPIIVTQKDGQYLIVAGERRFKASQKAGLNAIPAIVKELSDDQIYEIRSEERRVGKEC